MSPFGKQNFENFDFGPGRTRLFQTNFWADFKKIILGQEKRRIIYFGRDLTEKNRSLMAKQKFQFYDS